MAVSPRFLLRASALLGLGTLLLATAPALQASPTPEVPAEQRRVFADVPSSSPLYARVARLAEQGLFTGYPDGTFGGRRTLTHYEFAVALQRMVQELERRLSTQNWDGPLLQGKRALPEDHPWARVGADLRFRRQITEMVALLDEFGPELKLLGAAPDAYAGLRARAAKLPPAAVEQDYTPQPFDRSALDTLHLETPAARVRLGIGLLEREIARPSLQHVSPGFISVATTHLDFLMETVERFAASQPDRAVLRKAWRGTPAGRLRDCLTLTLGVMGETEAQKELAGLAGDTGLPFQVRAVAVKGLAAVRDVRTLQRLLEADPVWHRGWYSGGGCIVSGPEMREYVIRQAAKKALESIPEKQRSVEVRRALARAVTREPLRPEDFKPAPRPA